MKPETVNEYINSKENWKEELLLLREIFLESELSETIKWGMPVYTLDKKNVAGFSAFKTHAAIWFYQGVFLEDPENALVNAQEGVTKAMRQWRFESMEEIRHARATIKRYIEEAIVNQRKGMTLKPERKKKHVVPAELQQAFSNQEELKNKFDNLSPGRQREYIAYIGEAKRPSTRKERLKKIIPLILKGIGLNDRYRNP